MRLLPLLVAVAVGACHADGPVGTGADPRASRPVASGEWTLMHFLGGPPAEGQITDTLRLDPATTARHVRVERNRAGVPQERACDIDAADDAAWASLLAALADADLEAALAHPESMPGLMMDAGYFACSHEKVRVAVSDIGNADGTVPREAAALRRLASAYQRVLVEAIARPECASLRPPSVNDASRCEGDTDCAISVACCPTTTCGFEPRATSAEGAREEIAKCTVASCAAPRADPACPGPFDASKFRAACTSHVCVRVPR